MVEFFRMLNIFVAAYIGFVQAWPLSTEGLTEADRSKIQLVINNTLLTKFGTCSCLNFYNICSLILFYTAIYS